MKKVKHATKILFIVGIICSVSLLSLMPFMHFHEHCHDHEHCHEHEDTEPIPEDTEPIPTNEKCPACVFLNTPVTFQVPPITLVTDNLYIETLPLTEGSYISFNPTTHVQSRAPPTFSN